MRIKDLATRATKLLTGNALFVVDNGTKVEKVAYSEAMKQGIEEYAGSTLAGSAQTVKSAIDALNSKIVKFKTINVDQSGTTVTDISFNSIISAIVSNWGNAVCMVDGQGGYARITVYNPKTGDVYTDTRIEIRISYL